MVTFRLSFTPSPENAAAKFARLRRDGIYESIARLAQQADVIILGALQDAAPHRTGEFASAIHSAQIASAGSQLRLDYRAPNPLASWILHGTRPHIIEPKNPSGVLAFLASSGDVVFAHRVEHPGTAANDFPVRAWSSVSGDVAEILAKLGPGIMEQLQ
jgi:hypothetical protein